MPKFLEVSDTVAAKSAINADFYVNVKDYGAVGDGVADDTAEIHAARDAAGAGGTLFFPLGTYRVGVLEADVADQTWLLDQATLEHSAAPSDLLGAVLVTATGVSVIGGTIDMSAIEKDATVFKTHGIRVEADDVVVRDVTVINAPGSGIQFVNANNATITGCTVTDPMFVGILVQNMIAETDLYDFVIEGNTVTASGVEGDDLGSEFAGIYVRGEDQTTLNRVRIASNTVVMPYGTSGGFGQGIMIWRGTNSVIDGNVVVGGWAGLSCPWMKNFTISNNSCRGWWGIGIELPAEQIDVAITGNVLNCEGFGEWDNLTGISTSWTSGPGFTEGASVDFKNVTITGNSIGGFTQEDAVARGIFFSSGIDVKNVTVAGNTITAGGGSGQFSGIATNRNTENLTVTGNVFDAASRTDSRGLNIGGGTHTGMTVVGNNFVNCTTAAVGLSVLTSGVFTDIRVTGNLVRNCGATVAGDGVPVATRLVVDNESPLTSTATAAATTTLTAESTQTQRFTGTSTQTVVLPTTNIVAGRRFTIINSSTGALTVNASGGSTVVTVPGATTVTVTALQAAPTTNAHWAFSPTATPRIDRILDTNGNPAIDITIGSASAANFLEVTNAAAGQAVQLTAKSDDGGANVGLVLQSQGTGRIDFYALGSNFIQFEPVSSPRNYIMFRQGGPITGGDVQLNALGADSDVSIDLRPQGNGVVEVMGTPVALNSATSTHTCQQLELGNASDTTITRVSAGVIAVEGNTVSTRLTGTATLDFGSVNAQSFADLTITVTGAATGDAVALGTPTAAITAGIAFTAWVSATDTVTVRAHNYTAGALDPASGVFRATIIR